MKIASGCIDIVNGIAVFLPPPASTLTQTISSIFNMFAGGGTTDTATVIQNGFDEQSKLITAQFDHLKSWVEDALDLQTLEEMSFLAEGVLATLSSKLTFVNAFRDAEVTEDLAREIKNEIQVFNHNTDITTFRLVFSSYCDNIFAAYGSYGTNKDKEQKDNACLYMMYVYVMIETNSKSVVTSMISKLASSGAEYLDEIGNAFLEMQENRIDIAKTWLNEHFIDNSQLICAAFRHDNSIWDYSDTAKTYALVYIGAIDADLKSYIENYHCIEDSPNGKANKNS